jgi:acetyl esterase/lipase
MSLHHLDPELGDALAGTPPRDFAGLGISGVRAGSAERRQAARAARTPDPRVAVHDVATDRGVPIRMYQPAAHTGPADEGWRDRPAVLWFHGGGYMIGGFEDNADLLEAFVVDTGCVALSVEYRLAPEHPYPAALDDAYDALDWARRNAAPLGIDQTRMSVAGASAGGGLAACLSIKARDLGEPTISFQLLVYPLLDDRQTTTSATMPTVFWTKVENDIALDAYLGDDRSAVPPYAMAARADSLAGLPRTAMFVGELDLFRDDIIAFGQRLMAEGVSTDLRVIAGMPHAPENFAPTAAISRRFVAALREAFAVGIDRTRQ